MREKEKKRKKNVHVGYASAAEMKSSNVRFCQDNTSILIMTSHLPLTPHTHTHTHTQTLIPHEKTRKQF